MHKTRVTALVLLLLPVSIVLGSSTQRNPQPSSIQHEVTVTLKLIQVFVTDEHGNAVTDLNESDFEVYDNGQLKKITEFERHHLAAAAEGPERDVPAEPAKAPAAATPPRPSMNRKFFFILDAEKNDAQGLAQSKKTALSFVDTQAQPTDEIAVLSYQARRGLVIHECLSTDRDRIRSAIEKLRGVPGTGGGGLPTEPGTGGDALGALVLSHDPEAEELAVHRRNFVLILAEFAKALRSIPGYKNIVLFSGGFARSTLVEDSDLRHAYDEMSKEFGAASSPVYTVNSLGTRSNTLLSHQRGDATLQSLSDLSGGRYFEDVSKADKIVTGLQSATGNYYVLGYYIDERRDGRFHETKVRVKREGCRVSAQRGYYNPKPFAQFSDFEKELHLMELTFSDVPRFQSPAELPLLAFTCQDDSGAHLVMMAELPWGDLQEIMQPPAEAVSFVIDRNNNVIESKRGRLDIPDAAMKRIVYYDIKSLKPGVYTCLMILRNMQTGLAARARGTAMVSPQPASGLHLGPLLLLSPKADKDTVYFRLAAQSREPGGAARTLEEFFPFLSNRLVPVMDEIPRGESILAIIRSMASGLPNAVIEFSASLEPGSGGGDILLSPSILRSERQGKVDILLLELPVSEVEPGDYTLSITAKDQKSEAATTISRSVRFSE